MSASALDVLSTSQSKWIMDHSDPATFFNATDAGFALFKSAAKKKVAGGVDVKWSPMTARVGTPEFVVSGGTLPAGTAAFMKTASLDWKYGGLAPKRDKKDFNVYNAGDTQQIDLMKAWFENTAETMKELYAESIWLNRDAATAPTFAQSWISLVQAIDDTITYAGINPAVDTRWASKKTNLSGAEITIKDCVNMINEIRFIRGYKGRLDIYCGLARYLALENEGFGAIRHTNVGEKSKTELGIPTFTIHGCNVIVDAFLDAEPADASFASPDPRGIAGANKVYFVPVDECAFISQPKASQDGYKVLHDIFQVSNVVDLQPITREMQYQYTIEVGGVIALTNRRAAGVLINVG